MSLVLASASPRRRELLSLLTAEFVCRPADIDESSGFDEPPEDYVRRMAREKARRVWRPGQTVLGADTSVVLKNQILHKPTSYDDARGMLETLSGQTHEVMTSVVLMCDALVKTQMVKTSVQFGEPEPTIIDYYLTTNEPWDKAGAYGIQGFAGCFVTRLDGSYSGVVGLPLRETGALLRAVGLGHGAHGSHV